MTRRALVIGAAGDVGGGIVRALRDRGWGVTVAGRSITRLHDVFGPELPAIGIDLTTAESAEGSAREISPDSFDAVIVSVSARSGPVPLSDLTSDALMDRLRGNLFPHLNAARAFVAQMRPGALYLAIGGGMADFAVPGLAAESMVQAAERAMIRSVAKEYREAGVIVRLATIAAPVAGHGAALLDGLDAVPTDVIGAEIAAVVEAPMKTNGTVVTITDPRSPDAGMRR